MSYEEVNMADELERAFQSTLGGFLQATETGARVGATQANIAMQAKQLESELRLAEARERRAGEVATVDALLRLYGYQSQEEIAKIYGGRSRSSPNVFGLLNTGERISTDISKRNETIKAVASAPQSNNRFGQEIIELNKEMSRLDMSNSKNKEYIADRINDIGSKYIVGDIGGRATINVFKNSFWTTEAAVPKSVKAYTTIAGFTPEITSLIHNAAYGAKEPKPVYINEGDDLITKRANMVDVLNEVFIKMLSAEERNNIASSLGYSGWKVAVRDFSEIWLNPSKSKDNPVVEEVLKTLNQKGIYLASGGVITPLEASVLSTMKENMQSWERLDRINAAGRNMAGDFLGEEELFSPSKDTIMDYNTANTLMEKQRIWAQGQATEPSEYTPEVAKFEISEFAPAFVDTADSGFEAQRALVKYTSGRVSEILNADKSTQHDLLLNLIGDLHQHIVKDNVQNPMPPFIYESEFKALYKNIVNKSRVKTGLSSSEEKKYGVSR
jgi:hypothetical protein